MGNNSLPYEVVHCSSWDDEYDPEQLVKSSPGNQFEPSLIKSRGWQTPKCPDYPQDLIIHLVSGAGRISKLQILSHHFKIATKIDIYIGILKDPEDVLEDIAPDTPPNDNEDNMLIEFRKLGHVCFDNNARAQYRARELKSIKINADGEYIRLVVRNCHRNRLNEYNQVGLLALNILGQPLHLLDKNDIPSNSSTSLPQNQLARHPFDDNSVLSSSTRRTSVSSNQSQVSKLPTSSVIEIELQHWTQVLIHAEDEAVQSESYQIAKTYKYLSDKLERFTKILSDLEIGKRHAVETKDYDEAEKIKDDIKEIKQAAEAMLKHANIQITEDGRVIPIESTTLLGNESVMEDEIEDLQNEFKPMIEAPPLNHPFIDYNQHVQPDTQTEIPQSTTTSWIMEEETIPIPIDPDTIPEPIMDEERIPYTLPIQLFGEEIVACVLSIKVKCRGRGLGHIQEQIQSYYHLIQKNSADDFTFMILDKVHDDNTGDDILMRAASYIANATLMMIQEAVMDSREPIVSLAIETWEHLNQFCQAAQMEAQWIIEWTERAFSGLLKRTGDVNIKIRQTATALILLLIQDFAIPPYALMTLYITKPERLIHHHKEARARIELVETTVLQLGIQTNQDLNKKSPTKVQVPLQDLMAFVVAYLNHVHDDVRQAAVKLVVTISDLIGFQLVSTFIDETLRLSLAETVKKLVDQDPFYYYKEKSVFDSKEKKFNPNATKETLSELRALTVVKPEKRSTLSNNNRTTKKATTGTTTKSLPTKKTTATTSSKPTSAKSQRRSTTQTKSSYSTVDGRPQSKSAQQSMNDSTLLINENIICIFCNEVNPEFNEDTLIKHYYNNCPVLTNCPTCQIITEIPTLNEHMLLDCEKRHLIKECTRCHQAIPVEQWLQHTLKQVCQDAVDSNKIYCSLCSTSISPPNDAGWTKHLLTGEGCPGLKKSRRPKPQEKRKTIKH